MNTESNTATSASSAGSDFAASDFALDTQQQTLGSFAGNYLSRLKGGELGILPAMLSIFVLGGLFTYATQSRPGKFLSLYNGANLVQQAAAVIMISVGVTFVLLLGEIDLAAGWTAGVTAGVLVTALRDGRPLVVAAIMSLAAAALLGLFTGYMVSKVGIPSFVVTLANFLIFQGILLLITGDGGTVQLTNKTIRAIMNKNMGVAGSWILALLIIGGFTWAQWRRTQKERPGRVSDDRCDSEVPDRRRPRHRIDADLCPGPLQE